MTSLGSKTWGSGPTINMEFQYEKKRSGADMQYRAKIIIKPLTGASYFGYPIYAKIYMDNSLKVTKTMKSASTSQWSSNIEYTSSWYTISNKTSGTTAIKFNIYSGSGNSRNTNYSFSLPVDPAASKLGTIGSFTIGNAINIPITKYNKGFSDTLEISLGGTLIKTIGNISNGYDVSFSTTELNNIYKKIPSSTSGSFTFKLTTKNGGTTLGTSSKTVTGNISSSIKPSISSVSITEAGSVPSGWGVYVKNKTKIKVTTSASAGNGSSISSTKVSFNGVTYSGSPITTNVVNKTGSLDVVVTVTDKRNRSASTTKTISVVDYANPYISKINAFRCNADGTANDKGTYIKAELAGGVSSVNSKNDYSYKIQWRKTTESTWKTYTFDVTTNTINSSTILSSIENSSSYDVRAVITDSFTSVNKAAKTIPSVYRTISYKAGGHGVAIGKVAELENIFDIAMETRIIGGTKIDINGNLILPGNANLKNIIIASSQYMREGNYGLDLNNSDIIGANSVWFNDDSNSTYEGINFLKPGGDPSVESDYECLRGYNGYAYYAGKKLAYEHPVGSVVITATNSNPSSKLGGTWALIDQEFSSKASTKGGFNMNTTNCSNNSCYWCRAGHNITFELNFTPKKDVEDSTLEMGTIDCDKLGITRFTSTYRIMGYTDGGNCGVMLDVTTAGVVTTRDIIPDPYVSSGQNIVATFSATIHKDYMIDSACDKFYWKRTA